MKSSQLFLSIESKTNILYVNMNFTGNLLLEFGRYCDKLYLESTVFHSFWAPALARNFFFSILLLVNNSRKKSVSAFLLCFFGFGFVMVCIKFQGKRASRSGTGARGTWQSMIFTYFASSSALKFSWYFSFNIAGSTCSFNWCYIFSFDHFY